MTSFAPGEERARDDARDPTIGVIGLGYVGLPLAVGFGKQFTTIGFDVDVERVRQIAAGYDHTREVEPAELAQATGVTATSDPEALDRADVVIVTVPTPIDKNKRPDLGPLEAASRTAGRSLRRGNTVVYESTVFPGATEEVCVPILQRESGLTMNQDFWVGYSPERINPGDKAHRLSTIVKVTSGSCTEAAEFIDELYSRVVTAGTHRAPSIRVAEAAKVIENTQRDVNIALMNELALLFTRLGIDSHDVLAAARTKWNFLPFRPGLVGGHCIGVDPYYLTHKAAEVGHHPEVILAGRRINDAMGSYVADQVILHLARRDLVRRARVLILGLAFKENVPDLRNTRVVDVVRRLQEYGLSVDVVDPLVDPDDALSEYSIRLCPQDSVGDDYAATVYAVDHSAFRASGSPIMDALAKCALVFDVTATLPRELGAIRL